MKAHEHFSDPEWDGEPLEPEPKGPKYPGPERTPPGVTREDPTLPPKPTKIRVRLADGKERIIQHMMMTTFWHPDGTPMSAQQFLELLFGKLPEFFKNEEELRTLWSAPETRSQLLEALSEKGFGADQLAEMQRVIDAQHSDVFDVLAHIAYALPPMTHSERAELARKSLTDFDAKQQAFVSFVLGHYVKVGVQELSRDKLTPLLRLMYKNSIADATKELGPPAQIGTLFAGFQKYLYQPTADVAIQP